MSDRSSYILTIILQITVEHLEFSPLESKIYDSLYNDAKHTFQTMSDKGIVNKNYTSILALLMRYVLVSHLSDLVH